jgi:hypothetical protein
LINGNGEFLFGVVLTNDVFIQKGFDFVRARQRRTRGGGFLLGVVADDLDADVYALIANINRRTGNEFFDFVLAFAAKAATQCIFAASVHRVASALLVG